MKNLIIESENLYALKVLSGEYSGIVDVMPIDPPYNTSVEYISYKDTFPGKDWYSFMLERIEIAYCLLSPNGVMYIHIDENELINLSQICAQIFGNKNLSTLIWKKTNPLFDAGRIEKKTVNIRRIHEYVLLCYKNKEKTSLQKIKQPIYKDSFWNIETQYLESILDNFGTTTSAKNELQNLLGNKNNFPTPKPIKLIKEFIRAASQKNSIILDFFAGSGTTGHATMDLNKEDEGTRKFILVTNNENNICRDITVPRIKNAIIKYNYNEEFSFLSLINDF